MMSVGLNYALGVLFPVLMESFNESRERTAWVSSITMAVFLIFGPFMGAFVNRFGCRITITVGCLACATGLVLGSLAPNIVVLYLAFSVPFGIGMSSLYISSPVAVSQYFSKRRALALATATSGPGLGTMIYGPTLQALVDAFDWRNTMRMLAGFLAVASFTGCFLKSDSSLSSQRQDMNAKKFSLNFSACKNPRFLMLLAMAAVSNFGRIVPYVHLIKHCDDLGIPPGKSTTLFLLIGLFASTGRLMAGFLCDIRFINSRFLYQAAVFTVGASTLLLIPAKTFASVAVVIVLFSLADGLMISTFIIDLFKSMKESQRASCLGFTMFMGGVFVFFAPPLSGLIADKYGNYTLAFLMSGGVLVIGSLFPFFLLCSKQKNVEENEGVEHLEELMDRDQVLIKKNSQSDNPSPTNVWVMQDSVSSSEVVARSNNKLATAKRPVSFMWAMESPFNLPPPLRTSN